VTITQLLHVLLARWKVILLFPLLGLAVAAGVTQLLPTKYQATATVVLDFKGTDPILGVLLPGQVGGGYISTQVDIITSRRTAIEAVRLTGIADSPAARASFAKEDNSSGDIEDWLAGIFLRNLEVRPSRDSSVININFEGGDPVFAAKVANAFADAYQRINLDLRVEPARQTAAWFDDRVRSLRANVEKAQARLSAYQREKGFTAVDERADVETARLSELSQQLVASQAALADSTSRQRQLEDFLARGADPVSLPDVLANGLIQSLKSQLAATEARLEQTSSQLGVNHPEISRLTADIAKQKERLRAEIITVSASISNAARIAQRREADIRASVAEQKAKLLRLNQGRDEMAALIKEVDAAQRAYDSAASRFTQTNLESQATQTTIAVLNRAAPPVKPSFPRPMLNLFVGFVIGFILGVGAAVALELLNRRVRSEEDLWLSLDVPLLGTLASRKARGHGRVGAFLSWRKRPALPAPAAT
jgi:chain length determinant protein EpsF